MLQSAELLAVAQLLVDTPPRPPPQARLRRATSTAYYALFHHLAEAASSRFMGPGASATGGYLSLYRSFEHGIMRQAFITLTRPVVSARSARQLGRSTISPEIKFVAANFDTLQTQRQLADYDPQTLFRLNDVQSLIAASELAIVAFDQSPPDEQADVLAFLMVKPRP